MFKNASSAKTRLGARKTCTGVGAHPGSLALLASLHVLLLRVVAGTREEFMHSICACVLPMRVLTVMSIVSIVSVVSMVRCTDGCRSQIVGACKGELAHLQPGRLCRALQTPARKQPATTSTAAPDIDLPGPPKGPTADDGASFCTFTTRHAWHLP